MQKIDVLETDVTARRIALGPDYRFRQCRECGKAMGDVEQALCHDCCAAAVKRIPGLMRDASAMGQLLKKLHLEVSHLAPPNDCAHLPDSCCDMLCVDTVQRNNLLIDAMRMANKYDPDIPQYAEPKPRPVTRVPTWVWWLIGFVVGMALASIFR